LTQVNSYKGILKTTSVFGGVQALSIIFRIIKTKFVALFMGPEGMGIMNLIDATITLVSGITSFGLGVSAVREVAAVNARENGKNLPNTIAIINRAVWVTGFIGAVLTLIFSSYLSQLSFGNDNYRIAFIWLSITLVLNQLTIGNNVLIQGLRKVNFLAKSNLLGGFLGLLVSIPIYYFFKVDGIVPVIIITSVISFIIAKYYSSRIKIEPVRMTFVKAIKLAFPMAKMGLLISVNGLLVVGLSYVLRIIISQKGGFEAVGLFSVGFTMINVYVGMIFSSMASDYFPKLSEVADNSKLINLTINQQIEIALIILSPIIGIFIVYNKLIISLLFSEEFYGISTMIQIASIGIFFKAASWAVAYLFIVKRDNKAFMISEVTASLYMFCLNYLGYIVGDFTGLGFSFLLGYILYLFQVAILSKRFYGFHFNKELTIIFIVNISLCLMCLTVSQIVNQFLMYAVGSVLIILISSYSIIQLNKRIKLISILQSIFCKYPIFQTAFKC
jgi:O-antigen/teichoic acid export membrane protein